MLDNSRTHEYINTDERRRTRCRNTRQSGRETSVCTVKTTERTPHATAPPRPISFACHVTAIAAWISAQILSLYSWKQTQLSQAVPIGGPRRSTDPDAWHRPTCIWNQVPVNCAAQIHHIATADTFCRLTAAIKCNQMANSNWSACYHAASPN